MCEKLKMDPDSLSSSLFKWDTRAALAPPAARVYEPVTLQPQPQPQQQQPPPPSSMAATSAGMGGYLVRESRDLGGLEEVFHAYGVRYFTAAKILELGFTANTLLDMKDEELDEMMNSLCHIFRWDLLVGERYGIKAAVRAERRRLEEEDSRRRYLLGSDNTNTLDALSQEGLSEEPVQQEIEAVGSGGGGGGGWEFAAMGMCAGAKTKHGGQRKSKKLGVKGRIGSSSQAGRGDDNYENESDDEPENGGGGGAERQREHPFIVTEPGEVARGKKNGLDYLFHLYEQCRDFLIQVQTIAKERGEKCPTKVTNQVFRFAKKAGASYINKPKMRHYVHCYALHCLDEEGSNALRRDFKERGENVGAWRQACYKPLVTIAARQGWDIDAIFNTHPRLSIWYVPTKLRQLCHAERRAAATAASTSVGGGAAGGHLHF
ncbi:putative transcription factor LFY family [Helianthus annuus]|uniref:Floricaula/leafy-like transcription factor n=3 Tax=Helianthus annuus TaxID=4232 RepID=A0A251U300_HELAN|nr:floricaula/leafy homolog [Helianthus annuus]KAF5793054.1 putative transcription factor LFY family [Helianthus annuus]KAJ0544363.1 putative transcription factor LFY family [Helianthus annuus]